MTTYASNDCLAVSQLLIVPRANREMIDDDANRRKTNDDDRLHSTEIRTHPNLLQSKDPVEDQDREQNICPSDIGNADDQKDYGHNTDVEINPCPIELGQVNVVPTDLFVDEQERSQLTVEQRRKIHNRTCTLKQRRRYYQHQITIENVDRRFSIRTIKNVLRSKRVPFFAVNVTKSSAEARGLCIGIRNPAAIEECENTLHGLFDRRHFHQVMRREGTPRGNHCSNLR